MKKTMKCLYLLYSIESTTFMECKSDKELWEELWRETKKNYDDLNPCKPNHLVPNISHLKNSLKKYIANNFTLICELPSIMGVENHGDINYRIKNPFKNTPLHILSNPDMELIFSDIVEQCHKAKNLTEKLPELNRKKAAEILTFILSYSEREKSQYGVITYL